VVERKTLGLVCWRSGVQIQGRPNLAQRYKWFAIATRSNVCRYSSRVVLALGAEMGTVTRYTLRCNTMSMIKGLTWFYFD